MIKVMLVEDDPMVAEFNRDYVNSVEGFQVVASVRSAQEAWTALNQYAVDLILLDIYMPGTQGLQLLGDIRHQGLPADVILVTAASDTPTVQEALRLGAVDYLIKPFEFERLKQALNTYRERTEPLKTRETLSQGELDRMLGDKPRGNTAAVLPKGLDRHTLKRICESIQKYPAQDFSADDIAHVAGITRVSVRKYLEFLTEITAVTMTVTYGTVGRPVHRYRPNPGFRGCVDKF